MLARKHPTPVPDERTASAAAGHTPLSHPAAPEPATVSIRKNKVRIIVSIDPDLLAALDNVAVRKGLSRAGTMSLACADLIDREQQRLNHG